jgi:hypothetical protein
LSASPGKATSLSGKKGIYMIEAFVIQPQKLGFGLWIQKLGKKKAGD